MDTEDFDLVVLGGGNAISLAIGAGDAGLRTALVEKGPLGGTCPNVGCIPSKLLIGYADRARAVRDAGRFHIAATLDAIDGEALLAETFQATRKTDGNLERALPANVELLRGEGRFVAERTVAVGDRRLRGERVVIATGTRPRRPSEPFAEGLPWWTSDDIFRLEHIPESVAIVGGGFIACEMAHFLDGVGARVVLLVRGDRLLDPEDDDIRETFQRAFTARIETRFRTRLVDASHDGGRFHLALQTGDGNGDAGAIGTEALLWAIGRVPNTDDIGLDTAGIDLDERGFIVADDGLATSAEGVFALGDVIGRHPFTHAAAREATWLLDRLTGKVDGVLDYGPMPHAVFSSPEIAGVGATERDLIAAGTDHHAVSVPYTSAARGRAVKEDHGLCKFIVAPDGRILGCHIVGHEAATLIHEVIPVMKWRNDIRSLTEIIHIHPSLSEVVRNAARKAAALLDG